MANEKKTLENFKAVALSEEKTKAVKGGYMVSIHPRAEPAGYVGWGEVEIRNQGVQTFGMSFMNKILRRR
ncbi:MAG: hypothetical protein IPH04_13020 [Saprospirales bacterium]|jgi:hypothetical protein|nr:hypothetical protein [Saprospirales bacterium]MBK6903687.1 hypothetical protein [Saprospirales bacterium]MBK7337431.1 hypothetical protein [Saprospirales bacterium]